MRSTIHNFILASAVVAAAALAVNTAKAETTLKVPFGFTVAGRYCPAGLYSIQKDTARELVTLSSKDAARHFTWVVGPGEPAPSGALVVLRFHESGQSRELESVQYGSKITRQLDHKTKGAENVPVLTLASQ